MASVVKISISGEVEHTLERLKNHYSDLSESEIFCLGLAELDYKAEMEERQAWIDSLPILELSDEEQESLTEALKELEREKKEGTLKAMNFDELMAYLKSEK